MKWYVYFYKDGTKCCHCFEENETEARWFAGLVDGEARYEC